MLPKSTSEGGFGEAILANPTYKYSAIGAAAVLALVAYYSLWFVNEINSIKYLII